MAGEEERADDTEPASDTLSAFTLTVANSSPPGGGDGGGGW